MRVPYSWLKECLPTQLSPTQAAEALTMTGLEAEGIQQTPLSFSHVVVGEVLESTQHPDADTLRIAQVWDGTETVPVVCGATNCRPGLKVAFARVGAILTDDKGPFKIKKAKLRGIVSHGMLCSATELGLGGDDDGIMELPTQWAVGRDLNEYYGDTVIELALTPNLGHCFSILGVARELAAITKESLAPREVRIQESSHLIDATVDVQDPEGCPRYAARIIRNVQVGPSPTWIQTRLQAAGIHSINNIVDITNYVMLELGQPLHAFDYDTLEGKQLIVRRARQEEHLITLDGVSRALMPGVLLITDAKRPVAIAGVIGGQNSEVTDQTHNVLLEAAYFDASVIRHSAKTLHLHTESSKRFERGTDPNAVLAALERAASLLEGDIDAGFVDLRQREFPRQEIDLRIPRMNKMLGTQLSPNEAGGILKRLGCEVATTQDLLNITVPSYRSDLKSEIDLIEEVARLYGYNNIAQHTHRYKASSLPHTSLFVFERKIRRHLVGMGLQEIVTSNLISPTLAKNTLTLTDWISVLNPASIEQSVLRPSLFPGLLQVVAHNADHQERNLFGFEVGRVHFKVDEELKEETELGVILTGQTLPAHWDCKEHQVDFFDLKGIIEDLLEQSGLQSITFHPHSLSSFHPGRQASVLVGDREIGFLGEVHPRCLRALNLRQPVFYAGLVLPALLQNRKKPSTFKSLPQFPGSSRDWTVTLSEETPIALFLQLASKLPSRLLKKVSFTAIYRGDSLGAGWKNTTFRFVYRDDRKTVSDESVEAEHQRIVQQIEAQLGERIKLHES